MKKFKKVAALIMTAALAVSFSGCKKETASTGGQLSYWMEINENITANVSTFAETEYAKALEKATGVKVDYKHPAIGQGAEQFNLLLASGDLPDIIEYGWFEFPGGPGKAIKDGYIVALNDYIDEYAPNLKKYLEEHPEVDKMIKTDEGEYYCFPFIRGDEKLLLSAGPIVRVDLLEKLGIENPVTYDDWYNMLKKFKEAGVEIPLSFNATNTNEINSLLGMFGAASSYYIENGTVKFGPLEKEFKNTLMMLNKWYSEGLYDKNFTTSDAKIRESNVLLGKVGVTYGSGGGQLGKWIQALGADSDIKLGTLPYPVEKEGDYSKTKSISSMFPGNGAAITTACKDIPAAVKYLDFLYGEEGHRLVNFGIEGESYEMVDGVPTYTEKITKNPEGLSMSQAMSMYMRSYSGGPFVQDVGYIEQYYAFDEQKQALVNWCLGNTYRQEFSIPKILCTTDEASEMATITNNVNTYRDTMVLKFITGTESFDNYDKFLNQIKSLKIDRALEIQQSAYERYLGR